jgi:23S rRNA pseudouridine1911/1915/1917 synthase
MVCAKTDRAHAGLSELFHEHDIERQYIAFTHLAPRPLVGSVHTRIGRDSRDRLKMKANPDIESSFGREAITHYQVQQSFGAAGSRSGEPAAAMVACTLETGRTHQIRVHLAHIGATVIGDPLYGRRGGLRLLGDNAATQKARELVNAFPRQALHAALLGFRHPVTGKKVKAESPLPADMAELRAVLSAL